MRDVEATRKVLEALKSLGTRLSVDDFGTGYSSLTSLRSFPVDSLKVDRSFVSGLGNGHVAEDAAIVTAVISLAHNLGLIAVAEGIETAEQLVRTPLDGLRHGAGLLLRPPAARGRDR